MNIDQTIEENLKYIKELLKNNEEDELWEFYKGVISEMMKEYAIQYAQWICDDGWQSNPPIWSNGESMCDITGKSTYTEMTNKDLYKLYEEQLKDQL